MMNGEILISVWHVRELCRLLLATDPSNPLTLLEAVSISWPYAELGGDMMVKVCAEWMSQTITILLLAAIT